MATSPTTGLIEFLNARLDEDEQSAQAVIDEVGAVRVGEPYDDGSGIAEVDAFPSYSAGHRASELAFMAHWQPARMLREVAAKRQIIAEHTCPCPDDDCQDCGACSGGHHDDPTQTPCDTLRLLTTIYSDHPDYRKEWSV